MSPKGCDTASHVRGSTPSPDIPCFDCRRPLVLRKRGLFCPACRIFLPFKKKKR